MRRNLLLLLLGAVTVGVGVVGRESVAVARRANRSREQIEQGRAERAAAGQRAERRATERRDERAKLQRELARSTGNGDAPAPDSPTEPGPDKPEHSLLRLQKDPELIAFSLAANRAYFAATYGPFFRAQALTAEQIERLQTLVTDHEARQADLRATRLSSGLKEDDPAVARLLGEAEGEFEKARRALLGEAGYRQLQTYEATLGIRQIIGGLAGAAVIEGVPWTPAQADQMVQLVASHAVRAAAGDDVDAGTVRWAAVDIGAEAILSPEQLALFKTTQPPGPGGWGSRFQAILNHLLEKGYRADTKASPDVR